MVHKDTASIDIRNVRHTRVQPVSLMRQRVILRTGTKNSGGGPGQDTGARDGENKESGGICRNYKVGVGLTIFGGLLIAASSYVRAEDFTVNDGIPERTNQFEKEVVMHFWDDNTFSVKEEVFSPPVLGRDFGKVVPVDPNRLLQNIPTASLTKWHWWMLKDDVLNRAIRQYSKCVARVSLMQELMGEVGLDNPKHKDFGLIKQGEEYLPAFEVVQPFDYERGLDYVYLAGKRHYEENLRAVIASINITVGNRRACEDTENAYKAYFLSKFRRK